MRKVLSLVVGLFFLSSSLQGAEKLTVEKQLVGVLGAISGRYAFKNTPPISNPTLATQKNNNALKL